MNWFYAAEGQQKGPVSDMDFTMLIREGVIKGDTLVWKEGLPEWKPLSIVRPDLLPTASGAPELAGVPISEQSKDLVIQQMREGALPSAFGTSNPLGVRYAGFWIRVAAKLIDGILLTVVNFILTYLVFGTLMISMDPQKMQDMEQNPEAAAAFFATYLAFVAITIGINVAYNALCVYKWGGTLGKLAVGIKVVRADMLPMTFGRSIGRAFADMLNYFICYLTYLMPAFDEAEKRALHDHICGTRVIYK